MKILHKYHKQNIDRKVLKHYQEMSDEYGLKLKSKNTLDALKLSVFETALLNKKFFENKFEEIRNQNIDMWDIISFNERNFIIKCDIASLKIKQKHFKNDGENIYIPFFDKLLNKLYDDETAILELPQFFKLYKDFKDKIISIDSYGLKPYIANMSRAKCIVHNEEYLVLYDEEISCFYKMNLKECTRYPILESKDYSAETILKCSKSLLISDDQFIDSLIEYEMLNPKCVKKINKLREKGKGLE